MNAIRSKAYSYLQNFSLKRRIVILFIAGSLIPFAGIGLISYFTIDSILFNKIQLGIQSNLKQVQLSLENTISNMSHVSQQLSFDGTVGKKLDQFLLGDGPYETWSLSSEIKSEVGTITFTNPNIGLTMYYVAKDGTYLFENLNAVKHFDPGKLPVLDVTNKITYHAPHTSQDGLNNHNVLSILRKAGIPDRDDIYIYIESGFKLAQNILETDRLSQSSHHLLLSGDGTIAFSELPGVFPANGAFPGQHSGADHGTYRDYYWFKGTSTQGWSIVSVIPKAEYNKERNRWLVQIVIFSLLVLAISLLLAWLLWKMVYRPLTKFHKEMKRAGQSDFRTGSERTYIPEFDYLLREFGEMKQQIGALFLEVEQKEKRRADLEIEKLRYQINPHFLMNTLDTAHWLAVMNGQNEIDQLVVSLNKLLYYNLGKLGEQATVREELEALREYLTLQQIRYDFQFNVRMEADEHVLDMVIPRFILQPLVENALYHGLNDQGSIRVDVKYDGFIELSVHDNGEGMTEETIRHLLHNDQVEKKKVGMGIGMNYVKRMIEFYYDGQATMQIKSELGKGTSVILRLPAMEAERDV
ncbi:sensor histidine kinase [Paenibacillus arenilitoris]|uniref:histidine kinase n=1 Tax=Paenibacillus arenilitoris TaxID=2772299 RepID=A0A927CMR0_9BACL|nr:sensor histidine kinase [Paenibacillus arenilitoris]MBD2870869.1 sensor histidine kinase [Paenibacillus arenilitoris]